MKHGRTSNEGKTAHILLNSFLCCFKLRTGSFVVSFTNILMSVFGIWHSIHFGQQCRTTECPDISIVHYFWIGISVSSVIISTYLLFGLIKENCKAICVWILWNGLALILRFTVIVLILALKVENQSITGNVIFHVFAMFLIIYSILVLLSYNQQVTLTAFGFYQRYRYPSRGFPVVIKEEDYIELDDRDMEEEIEEVFV